jgi:hypothetical protein
LRSASKIAPHQLDAALEFFVAVFEVFENHRRFSKTSFWLMACRFFQLPAGEG